jgi:flagellar basal-body rod modification protein FlgD
MADSVSLLTTGPTIRPEKITICDASGNEVRVIDAGPQEAGKYSVDWDGNDASGERVPEGSYTCKVEAIDGSGGTSVLQTTIHGTVHAFRIEGGVPYYILDGADGIKLPVSDVYEIATPSEEA